MAAFVTHKHVLLVEPDARLCETLAARLRDLAIVEQHRHFEEARRALASGHFDLLISNIRLEAYNGLHLVYLSRSSGAVRHAIVYSHVHSEGLAYEAHRAGAFYEVQERLLVALPGYVESDLPAVDRRNAAGLDRRTLFRGGRRRWDVHLAAS